MRINKRQDKLHARATENCRSKCAREKSHINTVMPSNIVCTYGQHASRNILVARTLFPRVIFRVAQGVILVPLEGLSEDDVHQCRHDPHELQRHEITVLNLMIATAGHAQIQCMTAHFFTEQDTEST